MQILANDFTLLWKDIGKSVLPRIKSILAQGNFILGTEVDTFEQALAAYWDKQFAVGCGNGMDALEIALRVLEIQPGDKVITTPLSAFASTLAIVKTGGVPVFVDTDASGLMDLDQVEEILIKDPSIRFMLPVHLYGYPLNMAKLIQLKHTFNLKMVEDCAQSIGAVSDGISVGRAGDIVAVSFYPTKNLGAMGDGGALLMDKPAWYAKAKAVRNYGQSEVRYQHEYLGLNSRLDEVQAGILHFLLDEKLAGFLKRRRRIAQLYLNGISNNRIRMLNHSILNKPAWHLFPLFVEKDREHFREYCVDKKMQTSIHYPILIPDQIAMKSSPYFIHKNLKNARSIVDSEISLPIHPYLTNAEINQVIKICNGWKLS